MKSFFAFIVAVFIVVGIVYIPLRPAIEKYKERKREQKKIELLEKLVEEKNKSEK